MKTLANIIRRRLLFPLGIDTYLRTEDRRVLEQVIFPYIVGQPDLDRVLFVGCEIYTRGYNRVFRDKTYTTLEPDPGRRKYGASHHVVDGMQNIGHHFPEDSLDAVICNGVFGWGLDRRDEADKAIAGTAACLRKGGLFVVGWNDTPDRMPFRLDECPSLARFAPFAFPDLGTAVYLTHTGSRHTYSFFRRA
jgi:SAM-dependent methyltransferase